VPATAYSENWEYAQFFVGSSLAKLAVAFLFIPAFYPHNVTTIYEFLLHRYGQASQLTARSSSSLRVWPARVCAHGHSGGGGASLGLVAPADDCDLRGCLDRLHRDGRSET